MRAAGEGALHCCKCYNHILYGGYSSAAERLTVAQDVVGSIPTSRPKAHLLCFQQNSVFRSHSSCNVAQSGSGVKPLSPAPSRRLRVGRQRNIPAQVAGLYPCQGLVASITAATWLLELWLRTSLKETEHEKGLSVLAASIPLQAARLAAYLTLLPCNLEVNNHSFRNSLKEKPSPFSARMEFWRGTACEKHSRGLFRTGNRRRQQRPSARSESACRKASFRERARKCSMI